MTIRELTVDDRLDWVRLRESLWPGPFADHDIETRKYFDERVPPCWMSRAVSRGTMASRSSTIETGGRQAHCGSRREQLPRRGSRSEVTRPEECVRAGNTARVVGVRGRAIVGVSDHGGWAVLVTVAGDGRLLDRRRVELVDTGLPKLPYHHDAQRLPGQ